MPRSTVTLPVGNWIRERRAATCPRPGRPAKRRGIVTLALLACVLPSLVFAQKVPVGWEFQVNSYTTGQQGGYYDRVRMASDSAGNFVVVWDEAPPRDGPYARKFSSTGVPLGPEFLIDQGAYQPAVASDAAGNFVVTYSSYGYCQGSYGGMCARQFDSAGEPRGPSFLVETGLVSYSWNPKVASDAAGNFVVVWPGDPFGAYGYGHVWARRYDSTGTPLDATEFQVTTSNDPRCCWGGDHEDNDGLEVASDAAGNFMVVWNQEYYYLFGRVFDSAGVAAGPEFMIDSSLDRDTPQAGVTADGLGHFIVVWEGIHNEGIRGRRFDTAGTPVGAEFQVTSETTYTFLHIPRVSAGTAGDFVVVWSDYYGRDGYGMGVFGRQFDSTGSPLGADFQVNTYTHEDQGYSAVASASSGNFVVVWVSDYQDGYGTGIFGQRFGEPGPLGCRPTPMESCKYQTMARRGGLSLKDKFPDTKDRLRWKWVRGSETTLENFGNPLDETNEYALCVYDASENPQPVSQQLIPGGGECPGRPCWKQVGTKRFDYRNQDSSNLLKVFLKAADEGKARVGMTGRGNVLDMPELPLEPPVTVQFQASNGNCWEARYDDLISKNESETFRAKPGLSCGETAAPVCNGICPAGEQCADVGFGCECLPPCGKASAPECGGVCPAGLQCSDTGSGCGCLLVCSAAAEPACNGACPAGAECASTGPTCACVTCGNLEVEANEQCDDGNVANGDGCSGECFCNPETTPDVCNLTGDWIADNFFGDIPVTIIEDALGNSTFTAEGEPPVFSGQSTRLDSCGIGTITILSMGICPVRTMVADSCDAGTIIVDGCGVPPELSVGSLDRVVGSPSGAFLDVTNDAID